MQSDPTGTVALSNMMRGAMVGGEDSQSESNGAARRGANAPGARSLGRSAVKL